MLRLPPEGEELEAALRADQQGIGFGEDVVQTGIDDDPELVEFAVAEPELRVARRPAAARERPRRWRRVPLSLSRPASRSTVVL